MTHLVQHGAPARHLDLLAIVWVGAVFAVTSLRRVVKEIHHKIELAEVRSATSRRWRCASPWWARILSREADGGHAEAAQSLVQQLNTSATSSRLQTALSETGTEGRDQAEARGEALPHRALRLLESGVDDPSQETAAKAVKDIEVIIDDAVDRAIFYAYRTSEVIETANRGILRSANNTTSR